MRLLPYLDYDERATLPFHAGASRFTTGTRRLPCSRRADLYPLRSDLDVTTDPYALDRLIARHHYNPPALSSPFALGHDELPQCVGRFALSISAFPGSLPHVARRPRHS
jgi:hypothetical protein